MDNLWNLLERNARNFSDAVAVRYPAEKRNLSWLELRDEALKLANKLTSLGVIKGDRLGTLFPNCPEFIVTFYAVAYIGAVVVPINARLTVPEINYILEDSGARALLFSEDKRETAEKAIEGTQVTVLLSDADFSKDVIKKSVILEYRASGYSQATEMAEILYTSGTTGRPKGVMLSHYSVIAVAQMMAYEAQILSGDNALVLMPLTHSAPLNLFMVGACWAGASVTLGEFTPQTLLELAVSERTTHFFGAPVAYQFMLRVPNLTDYDLSSMKCWIYGGAPVAREQILAWQKVIPGKFMSVYGLTEAGPNGMALRPTEHDKKAGSIGNRGAINSEVKLLSETGSEVANGEIGEIALKVPSFMLGYYNNPIATEQTILDGWLLTGDIARKDEDGYIWFMDRKKDMIISGGVNVYPKEIEDLLRTHPDITDVAVIGLPHLDWGETVCAVIEVTPGSHPIEASVLKDFCSGTLADYKIPKLVKVVPALPRNSSGKILKFALRAGQS